MTVYIDVLFLENLFLNYIILLATAISRKSTIYFSKIFLASLIGSIFGIVNYVLPLNMILNFLFKIILSIVMVLIGFKNYNIKIFIKNILSLYLITLTFGGAAFMFMFFIDPEKIILKSNHFIGLYPVKMAILGGGFAFLLIILISKLVKDRIKNLICDLEVGYNGKIIKIKSFIDSRKFVERANFWRRCYYN
jgi:stage II sporulation protein GA (sporulation sigma-E factor processing peptidase)